MLDLSAKPCDTLNMEPNQNATENVYNSSKRVLLVEDDSINRELFAEYLKILGAECIAVSCANSAVAALTGAIGSGGFGLVLMDLHMPQKDGVQATVEWREIEDREGLKPTPIYAITADVRTEERCRCLDSGMNGFLSKPFRLKDLSRLLVEVLAEG